MSRLRLRRGLAVLLVLIPLSGLWDWLTGFWADEGCGIDPGGHCAPAPSTDEGCGLDPWGRTCPDRQ